MGRSPSARYLARYRVMNGFVLSSQRLFSLKRTFLPVLETVRRGRYSTWSPSARTFVIANGLHPVSDFSVISRVRTALILRKHFEIAYRSRYRLQYLQSLETAYRSWNPSARNLPEPIRKMNRDCYRAHLRPLER